MAGVYLSDLCGDLGGFFERPEGEEGSADQYEAATCCLCCRHPPPPQLRHKNISQTEEKWNEKKKTFPICHVAREKEALNKPFQQGLAEPTESSRANCDGGNLDGDFIHYPGREKKLVSDTSPRQITSTPTGQWLKEQ